MDWKLDFYDKIRTHLFLIIFFTAIIGVNIPINIKNGYCVNWGLMIALILGVLYFIIRVIIYKISNRKKACQN